MSDKCQKLPLAGSKSNFRFTPESRLNSEIAASPKSANMRHRWLGLLQLLKLPSQQPTSPAIDSAHRTIAAFF
jgi:hypothetical protein